MALELDFTVCDGNNPRVLSRLIQLLQSLRPQLNLPALFTRLRADKALNCHF